MTPDRPSVLVVEDEAIVALDLSVQLEQMGYRVVGTAQTGEEAIELACLHRPQLALLDVMLNGPMDGIEAAQRLGKLTATPVVFLTSFSDSETVARAARAAPYGYMTKPFQSKELRAAIEVALYKSRMETQLRESERWFSSSLRSVEDGVVLLEADGVVRFMNARAESLTGWRVDDAVGHHVAQVASLKPGSAGGEDVAARTLRDLAVAGPDFAVALQRRDGTDAPVDASCAPVWDEGGQPLGAVLVLRDARPRLQQEERLRGSEARLRNIFECAPLGMAFVSLEGSFLRANDALCKFLGREEGELSRTPHAQLTFPADVDAEAGWQRQLLAGHIPVAQFEKRYRHPGGAVLWSLVSVSLLHDGSAPWCFLYQVHDLQERKQVEQRLAHLAYHDPLTGLANRTRFLVELDRQIAHARRRKSGFAVAYMDLDRFKLVNDGLGHETGDRLLKHVARCVGQALRETDFAARLGGDEFVFVVNDVSDVETVRAVVTKVARAVATPLLFETGPLVITPSIGVCLYPEHGQGAEALLRHADQALYAAKAAGRNGVRFFEPLAAAAG